jgi:hypothetical protein
MQIQVTIPDELVEKIVRAIMDNFPEASMTLQCQSFRYQTMDFKFMDTEDGKEYILDKDKLLKAFPLMFDVNKWPKGLTAPPLTNDWDKWDDWLCQSDAFTFDAFLQLACLGEVVYG